MPKIHTHLHLGCLLNDLIHIEDFDSFQLGNVYPDCFGFSEEEAIKRHFKANMNVSCNLNELIKLAPWDSFTLGYYFHLWVDNYVLHIDLKNITKSDCLICDMEVIHDVINELSHKTFKEKELEAMRIVHLLDVMPMPLYLVDVNTKNTYKQILSDIINAFITENQKYLKMR